MTKNININPFNEELPSEYADRLGIYYTKQVTAKHKKDNGQFFTPIPIARLMASYCKEGDTTVKILDPGCGTAILTCTLIEHLVNTKINIEVIELVVYETDECLVPFSTRVLEYIKSWLKKRDIILNYVLNQYDFILDNYKALQKNYRSELFDFIISNPPYFKLAKDDVKTIAAKELVSGQPNIYSIFMGIAAKLLADRGELIFITPRSFASGNYFKAFRELFFNTVQIDTIHLFNSRKDTFNRDSVLQETVIIKAIKESIDPNKRVLVSSSNGIIDISEPVIKHFNSSELIDLSSREKILHLPTSDKEESILNLVSSWENFLSDFNIKISTGPVVSFRSKQFLQDNYENGTVFLAPLFWLHNVGKMILEWPKEFKDKEKYIRLENASKSILIPNKNYIFLRRFSTKDDKSRLIAAPYFCNYIKSDFIGVENKVNYIYRKNGHLNRDEMVGLCALLNSELFDTYFQIFNGNVNVSATELREMRLPPLDDIIRIGNRIILSNDYSMANVNTIINEIYELEAIMN
ncbi:Eco57I restriction-modification methylase domain-containing protein [Flavobacterium cerinum]|uniref:site-specific DNA-methyltransferase (adenine-specific) n=1 Tax=Flavobacterium cerinum TaxID=2502784 RepID=A0ABY5IRR9_9FLAO|nr:Eco57I restriction-modification methylase domain-containing protein [Flavobacterium cerinum]UUC44136.1 Eco57I restriction-modification methylase domain-containing protein [Flavobacterium cerinum]